MSSAQRRNIYTTCCTLVLAICLWPRASLAARHEATYEQKIKPLLTAKCVECHSSSTQTSGFSISSLESVIRGGNKHGRAVIGGRPAAHSRGNEGVRRSHFAHCL